jgi:ABC-type sugar transport system substrate-binding protein
MKRIGSIVLVLMMLLSLVACGTTPSANETPAQNTPNAPKTEGSNTQAESKDQLNADGLGGYKIGFWYLPPTDALSKTFRDTLDYLADMTNCTMEYYDMAEYSMAAQTAAVETLVSNGCDAVIMIVGSSPAMYELMNDNGVYYVGMTRSLNDEVAAVTQTSKYCTGWLGDEGGVGGQQYNIGFQLAEALGQAGCKNIAVLAGSEGETMNDERVAGMEDAAKQYGMDILASYRGQDHVTGYADILAAFGSELDGIVASSQGDTGIAAIQAAGYLGKIKLAQTDPPADAEKYLEDGLLHATTAGAGSYIINMYMQLFNGLTEADRLFEGGRKLVPGIPGFVVTTAEEWRMASFCTMEELPGGFTPDQVLQLNSKCAPGMTVAEREGLWKSYGAADYWNIDALFARVSEYVG